MSHQICKTRWGIVSLMSSKPGFFVRTYVDPPASRTRSGLEPDDSAFSDSVILSPSPRTTDFSSRCRWLEAARWCKEEKSI